MRYDGYIVSGQVVSRRRAEIRAPLHMLHRVTGERQLRVLSHRTADGKYWYSLPCKSELEACMFMQKVRDMYPEGRETRVCVAACQERGE
jgi:hypothetical protein